MMTETRVDLGDVDTQSEDDAISTQSDTRPLIGERDPRGINENLKVSFEDVIAEPKSLRSPDGVWVWSHALFEVCRLWTYHGVTGLLAVPVSLLGGMLFALLSFLHIWLFVPCVQFLLISTYGCEAAWSSFIDIYFAPLFRGLGKCWGATSVHLAQV